MQSKHIFAVVGLIAAGALVFLLFRQPGSEPTAWEAQPSAPEIQSPPFETQTPPPVVQVQRQAGPIRQTDDDGAIWSIDLADTGRSGVQAGPPVIVKTDVYRSGPDVSIGLVLEGQAGERFQPVVTKKGLRMPAPKLRIVNEAGQVILDDSFRYG